MPVLTRVDRPTMHYMLQPPSIDVSFGKSTVERTVRQYIRHKVY